MQLNGIQQLFILICTLFLFRHVKKKLVLCAWLACTEVIGQRWFSKESLKREGLGSLFAIQTHLAASSLVEDECKWPTAGGQWTVKSESPT